MSLLHRVDGLGSVIGPYSLLLVDAYGVIHDGRQVFLGVADALRRAREMGKTVIVVTNSPQRTDGMVERLRNVGLEDGLYDAIACSGELTFRDLEAHNLRSATLPKVHFIREGHGPRWRTEVRNPVVDTIAEADLIIPIGMPYLTDVAARTGDFLATLRSGADRGVPMLVADSDETYPEDGKVRLGPGWIAKRYAEMGGMITEYGKPFDPIYDEALRLAGGRGSTEVLMIGDNLATDVTGATRRGFASLLVLEGGVHGWLSPAEFEGAVVASGVRPTYVTRGLSW